MYLVLHAAKSDCCADLQEWLNQKLAEGWRLVTVYGDKFIFENAKCGSVNVSFDTVTGAMNFGTRGVGE